MGRATWALIALVLAAGSAGAQDRTDLTERLRGRLPPETAERVFRLVDESRARGLPAAALERRALELAAKGVPPEALERAIEAHARRLAASREALARAGVANPHADEVAAAAVAIGKGADGPSIAELARSAGPGRSLAVPLTVLGGLLDRGLPVGEALARLEALPRRGPEAPGAVGLDIAGAARNGARGRGGPPAWVPIPGGNVPRPVNPAEPEGPPNRPPNGPPNGPPNWRP